MDALQQRDGGGGGHGQGADGDDEEGQGTDGEGWVTDLTYGDWEEASLEGEAYETDGGG